MFMFCAEASTNGPKAGGKGTRLRHTEQRWGQGYRI